tara:strand:+ start:5087 stop:5344 length:258 start_codon:yes stop_codon:yes gene_type:complete
MALPISPRNVSLVISALFLNFSTSNVAKVFPADKSIDCGSDRQAFSRLHVHAATDKMVAYSTREKALHELCFQDLSSQLSTMVGF